MDLLDQLADAVKEAAIPNWKTNHYEKIHFLKIGELQKLDKTDGSIEQIFTIKNYFKTEFEENWYLPVIHIAICGTVLEAKVWRNNFWFEILDETGSIACVTDIYNIPWNNLNNNYYIYHRKFRELEAEFKNSELLQTHSKFQHDYSMTMWLLFRKKKKIYAENYEIQIKERSEIIGKKLIIYGQLKQMGVNRFIAVRKLKIIKSSNDESVFNEHISNSYLVQNSFKIPFI